MIDFSRFIPARTNEERSRNWQAELDRRERERTRLERASRLDKASDCRLKPEMRTAIVNGGPLDDTESLVAIRRWAASGNSRPVLVLNGGTGCGKSVAAAWYVAMVGGGWLAAEQACRIFAAAYGPQFERSAQARDCRVLVLDDVGQEYDPQRMLHVATELLEARKGHHRTVITTNLTRAALEARYPSERLWSRAAESVQWSSSAGPDLRRRGTP